MKKEYHTVATFASGNEFSATQTIQKGTLKYSTHTSFIALLFFFFADYQTSFGQDGVRVANSAGTADPSAMLDIVSTAKGVLIPRMTSIQRTSIASPATGLLVFQTDGTPGFYYNAGTPGSPNWIVLSAGAISGVGVTNQVARWTTSTILGTGVIFDNGTRVGINTTSPATSASLDITSTTQGFAMPRMTSAQRKAIAAPVDGLQVYDTDLKGFYYYNGTKWDGVSVPAGSVNHFASNTAPAGYLACNGAAVNRTTYAELFAAIGTTFGAGDGSTTFNLPDLRGEHIRGMDNGRGADPGRTFGSFQNFDWKGFTMTNTGQNTFAYSHGPVYMGKSTSSFVGNLFIGGWSAPSAALGTMWDSNEIRVRNVALLACIKY